MDYSFGRSAPTATQPVQHNYCGISLLPSLPSPLLARRDMIHSETNDKQTPHQLNGLILPRCVTQREAADTQRRLYLRQSELETELEDLHAHHDALRVEMARMDASMQDAADASFPSSSSLSGRGGGGGAAGARKSAGRDPAAIGAEVGGAVGGVLSGRFWSGWRGGGGGPADTAEGAASRAGGQAALEEASKKSTSRSGGRGGAGVGDATQEVCVCPVCLVYSSVLFVHSSLYSPLNFTIWTIYEPCL